jgi:hypothetical protein
LPLAQVALLSMASQRVIIVVARSPMQVMLTVMDYAIDNKATFASNNV